MITHELHNDNFILVYANKQDLPGAMSTSEVLDKLDLNSIKDKPWFLQPSSAIKGDGLQDGL